MIVLYFPTLPENSVQASVKAEFWKWKFLVRLVSAHHLEYRWRKTIFFTTFFSYDHVWCWANLNKYLDLVIDGEAILVIELLMILFFTRFIDSVAYFTDVKRLPRSLFIQYGGSFLETTQN